MANVPYGKDFIKFIKGHMDDLVVRRQKEIALESHRLLVGETPVDTGQARAGWNILALRPSKKKPKARKRKPGQSGPLIAAPVTKLGREIKRPSQSYFLNNNVEHIVYLNEGSSTKAPSNFVETNLKDAIKNVEKVRDVRAIKKSNF